MDGAACRAGPHIPKGAVAHIRRGIPDSAGWTLDQTPLVNVVTVWHVGVAGPTERCFGCNKGTFQKRTNAGAEREKEREKLHVLWLENISRNGVEVGE